MSTLLGPYPCAITGATPLLSVAESPVYDVLAYMPDGAKPFKLKPQQVWNAANLDENPLAAVNGRAVGCVIVDGDRVVLDWVPVPAAGCTGGDASQEAIAMLEAKVAMLEMRLDRAGVAR